MTISVIQVAVASASESTGTKIALLLGGIAVGALVTGALQFGMKLWDMRISKRVAARLVLGNTYVSEAAFKLLIERKTWFNFNFEPALETWATHRKDFAAAVSMADWAEVDAFYDNLFRTTAMAKPAGYPADDADQRVAAEMVEYAQAARQVAVEHVPKGFKFPLPSKTPDRLANLISKRQREITETVVRLEKQEVGTIERLGEAPDLPA